VPIWEVDGALRGIVVDSGDNRVTLRYLPGSVLAGALLTGCALLGIPLALLLISRQLRQTPGSQAAVKERAHDGSGVGLA